MIYTFIADISRLDTEAALEFQNQAVIKDKIHSVNETILMPNGSFPAAVLGKEVLSHILSASNAEVRHERLGAYLLLSSVVKIMFGKMPEVLRTDNGKPYFSREHKIFFGMSHSGDVAAISISVEKAVGVDVEGEIDADRAARLEKRFFSELSFSELPADVKYTFVKMEKTGECSFYPLCCPAGQKKYINKECITSLYPTGYHESFSAKWTLYEATLKCDGGGFTSLPCLGMLLLETKADTVKLVLSGKTYYISSSESR